MQPGHAPRMASAGIVRNHGTRLRTPQRTASTRRDGLDARLRRDGAPGRRGGTARLHLRLDDRAPLRRRRVHALAPRGGRGDRAGDVADRARHGRHPGAVAPAAPPGRGCGDRPAAQPRAADPGPRARVVGGRVRRARCRHPPSRRGHGRDPADPPAGLDRRAVHAPGTGLRPPDARRPAGASHADPRPRRRQRRGRHPPRRAARRRHLRERPRRRVRRAGGLGARRVRAHRPRPVHLPVRPLLDPAARCLPPGRARPLPRPALGDAVEVLRHGGLGDAPAAAAGRAAVRSPGSMRW